MAKEEYMELNELHEYLYNFLQILDENNLDKNIMKCREFIENMIAESELFDNLDLMLLEKNMELSEQLIDKLREYRDFIEFLYNYIEEYNAMMNCVYAPPEHFGIYKKPEL